MTEATLAVPETRRCAQCTTSKPLREFYRDRSRKGGRGYRCKECINPGGRRRPEPLPRAPYGSRTPAQLALDKRLRKYGITGEQYEQAWAEQGKRCAGCGGTETKGRNWHVDHDHRTGRFRGILCHGCNLALGHMDDDAERLARLAVYAARQAAIAAG